MDSETLYSKEIVGAPGRTLLELFLKTWKKKWRFLCMVFRPNPDSTNISHLSALVNLVFGEYSWGILL